MNILRITLILLVTLITGCSINHPVAQDYEAHLEKYGSETTLPKTNMEADYLIGSDTEQHHYEFRAASVGAAHLWIVEFGKILDQTLQADYVQSAFGRLDKTTVPYSNNGNLIVFELESFEFKDYKAHTALNIKIMYGTDELFNKTYQAEGESQAGQMWTAGPFGMKNATLKSTKQSIDIILAQFINDINTH